MEMPAAHRRTMSRDPQPSGMTTTAWVMPARRALVFRMQTDRGSRRPVRRETERRKRRRGEQRRHRERDERDVARREVSPSERVPPTSDPHQRRGEQHEQRRHRRKEQAWSEERVTMEVEEQHPDHAEQVRGAGAQIR